MLKTYYNIAFQIVSIIVVLLIMYLSLSLIVGVGIEMRPYSLLGILIAFVVGFSTYSIGSPVVDRAFSFEYTR